MRSAYLLVILASFIFASCEKTSNAAPTYECPPCDQNCPQCDKPESSGSWTLTIPTNDRNKPFIGLKVYNQEHASWAPDGFNQIHGVEEDGTRSSMIMGYASGAENFKISIPNRISRVDIQVGNPAIDGHEFTVTR